MSSLLWRSWRPLTVGALVGAGGGWYYYHSTHPTHFDIRVRALGTDGKPAMVVRSVPRLRDAEVNRRLAQNSTSSEVVRDSIVWKHTTATLAANDPIEDANANAIVQCPTGKGDLLFFAVMDGHGGYHTSRLLAKTLIPSVGLELNELMRDPGLPPVHDIGVWNYLKKFFVSSGSSIDGQTTTFDSQPRYMELAIQTAFAKLDSEIVNAPLRLLASHLEQQRSGVVDDKPFNHPMALPVMLPAISGSCALLTLVDTAHSNLYVACTGDSRAVAGLYERPSQKWVVDVLSEDQTGRNPNELRRMQSEHPAEESEYVIQRGRVLGGLEPTRAFGDARYKWTLETQQQLAHNFLAESSVSMRSPPRGLRSPPYVTPRPMLTHRKVSLPNTSSSNGKPMRFVVMATDGLWDELSSEQVVQLVAGHLSGLRGTVSRAELNKRVPTEIGTAGVEGKAAGRKVNEDDDGPAWSFEDENLSVHLIRNALGGADKEKLAKKVSIPSPSARQFRDDMTITVLSWEADSRSDEQPR